MTTDLKTETKIEVSDVIQSITRQRDGLMNAVAQLEAVIAAKDREIAALKADKEAKRDISLAS